MTRQALLTDYCKVRVRKCDVPHFLCDSAFLQSWDDSDDDVYIPSSVCKLNDCVTDRRELVHMLKTLRFWIVVDLPDSVFHYVLHDFSISDLDGCISTLQEFEFTLPQVPLLLCLLKAAVEDRWWVALEHGNLRCIKYLFRVNFHVELRDSCTVAAGVGHIPTLEFLREQGSPWDEQTCANAAKYGHIDCLKYLHQNGCPWDHTTCDVSAAAGQVECLKYAVDNKCVCRAAVLMEAARTGQVQVLQALPLRTTCRSLVDEAANLSAQEGHLPSLKYLHSVGCTWTSAATALAARNGHLECLKYLHEDVLCPWDSDTTLKAAHFGHMQCLKYAVERGCETRGPAYSDAATDEIRKFIGDSLGYIMIWDNGKIVETYFPYIQ